MGIFLGAGGTPSSLGSVREFSPHTHTYFFVTELSVPYDYSWDCLKEAGKRAPEHMKSEMCLPAFSTIVTSMQPLVALVLTGKLVPGFFYSHSRPPTQYSGFKPNVNLCNTANVSTHNQIGIQPGKSTWNSWTRSNWSQALTQLISVNNLGKGFALLPQ